jgi:hypothetical protein
MVLIKLRWNILKSNRRSRHLGVMPQVGPLSLEYQEDIGAETLA